VKRQSPFAWLAKKLAPYLAPLIAAEVARQLSLRDKPPPEEPKRRYIGES